MGMNINVNERASNSQETHILRYLQDGNTITAIKALELFECFKLASRIYELRKRGYDIESRFITTNNGKRFAEYFMAKPINK